MSIEKQVPVEVYSRVSGYYRPVNQWNKGKRIEFANREPVLLDKAFEEIKNESCS